MAEHFMTGITKEGSVILITLNDRPNPIKYNCNTGELTSFTGRAVKHFPQSCVVGDVNNVERWAINTVREHIKYNVIYAFGKLEMFIAALDLIQNPYRIPDECPRGYVKWVRNNDKDISYDTLEEFYDEQNLNKLSKEDKEVYERLRTAFSSNDRLIKWWVKEENTVLRQKFRQMFKTTIKCHAWNLYDDLRSWYSYFIGTNSGWHVWGDNWVENLDGNRDFRYNVNTCQQQGDKKRNDKILANEEKIRSITEIESNNFVIIVPSEMDDFTKEGQMQHNCVGSYYHEAIALGDSLIYFIRKKSNPNHSYITNRYSIPCGKTVETRMINNRINNDTKALALIEIIDKKITELLKAKE